MRGSVRPTISVAKRVVSEGGRTESAGGLSLRVMKEPQALDVHQWSDVSSDGERSQHVLSVPVKKDRGYQSARKILLFIGVTFVAK